MALLAGVLHQQVVAAVAVVLEELAVPVVVSAAVVLEEITEVEVDHRLDQ
jgi:hypothetical protein